MAEDKIVAEKSLKEEIRKILLQLPRLSNEVDFKKKYREVTSQSIGQRLVEVF